MAFGRWKQMHGIWQLQGNHFEEEFHDSNVPNEFERALYTFRVYPQHNSRIFFRMPDPKNVSRHPGGDATASLGGGGRSKIP